MTANKQQTLVYELTRFKGMTDEDVAEEMHVPVKIVRYLKNKEFKQRRKAWEKANRENAAPSQTAWRSIA